MTPPALQVTLARPRRQRNVHVLSARLIHEPPEAAEESLEVIGQAAMRGNSEQLGRMLEISLERLENLVRGG